MENYNLEEKLILIFNNVNDWLKFAETKNGVFVGFIGAILFALLSSWNTLDNETQLVSQYIIFPVGIIVLIILSITFIPKFNVKGILKKKKRDNKEVKNLFYFIYLKTLTNTELLNQLSQEINIKKPVNYKRMELDLADQIIVNAHITCRKYAYFRCAILIAISGFLLSFILIVVLKIIN